MLILIIYIRPFCIPYYAALIIIIYPHPGTPIFSYPTSFPLYINMAQPKLIDEHNFITMNGKLRNLHANKQKTQPRDEALQNQTLCTIPIVNQKKIPLHFRPYKSTYKLANFQKAESEQPTFWGCIVPSHIATINIKKLKRVSKSLPSRHEISRSPSIEKSQMLLTKYMGRKQRRQQRQPQSNNLYSITNCSDIKQSDMSPCQNTAVLSPMMRKWNITTLHSTEEESLELPARKIKREQEYKQQERRIGELNQVIKWRSKMLTSIQDEMERIRNDCMWRY